MSDSPNPLDGIAEYATNGLAAHIGIEIVELTPERVVATMPVDARTRQPYGLLHGGASVALAETVASIASIINIDRQQFRAVGLEINANHIRAKTEGIVRATATPIRIGRVIRNQAGSAPRKWGRFEHGFARGAKERQPVLR